jgi:hypothetical protein
MRLHRLAHARAGDKGNVSDISVIAYEPGDYEFLRAQVTADRVREHFADIAGGPVERYELPRLHALKFVLHYRRAGTRPGGARRHPVRRDSLRPAAGGRATAASAPAARGVDRGARGRHVPASPGSRRHRPWRRRANALGQR